MKLALAYILLGLVLLVGGILAFVTLWPRPPDTTAPWVFSGDGAELNYCDLPALDGKGASADEIPKAYTPGCGFTQMPMPILQACREPLATGVPDLRGLWLAQSGLMGHLERVEQCGNRMVVTTAGIIHDFRMDGTLKNGARDIQSYCTNFASAIKVDEQGKVIFRLFNLFDTVSRHLEDENMIFTFVDGTETRMKRTCYLPKDSIGMYAAGF
ncbi:MAG: hypothetical protein AAF541_12595 [Pseudomonadota bacterium]